MIIRDAEELLTQWGRWSVQGVGTPGCFSPGESPTAWITDDEALMIDGMVARLGVRYPECAEVLKCYYRHDVTFAELGKKVGMGKDKAWQLWKAGVAWIDGALEFREKAA